MDFFQVFFSYFFFHFCLFDGFGSQYSHHHHVTLQAQTLSRHPSLSSTASGRSSGLHPVSAQSCCMQLRVGRPTFGRPYEGVNRSTSLMSSSLLLQQCPACLVRLTQIVFVMGVRQPYRFCFVGCCLQDMFNIARSILVQLPSSFFSGRLVSVHVVHPYKSIDTTAVWKKLRFLLSVRSDFHMTDSLSLAVHAFASLLSMSVSVDETVNSSTNFRELPFSVDQRNITMTYTLIFTISCNFLHHFICCKFFTPSIACGFSLESG